MEKETAGTAMAEHQRALARALMLTVTFFLIELIGGYIAGSLALMSDAVHMSADAASLIIALSAAHLCERSPDTKRTYGYYRFEPIAAALNATILLGVASFIFIKAIQRFFHPRDIDLGLMTIVAVAGLAANYVSIRILSSGADRNLNVKGAYLEVLCDFVSSIGVLAGAVAMTFTHIRWIDPLLALGISVWMLPRAWAILRESINILLEGVPEGLDVTVIDRAIAAYPQVRSVHDLHVWALGTGRPSLSAHVVIDPEEKNPLAVLGALKKVLRERFNIQKSTLQLEK